MMMMVMIHQPLVNSRSTVSHKLLRQEIFSIYLMTSIRINNFANDSNYALVFLFDNELDTLYSL